MATNTLRNIRRNIIDALDPPSRLTKPGRFLDPQAALARVKSRHL
jgi:hypothetical protein